MSPSSPITFFDIASNQPLRTHAPNPWKSRYALNLKRLSYQTKWVDLPDIHTVREQLGVPANRTHPDGKPYHTLPLIQDTSTGVLVGDSFEIAIYLDKTYPDGPTLIKPGTTGLTAAFNAQVDALFTKYVMLCDQMPFDPDMAVKVDAIFAKRAESMDATVVAEHTSMQLPREELFVQFDKALGQFVKCYYHVGGTTDYFWSENGTAKAQAQRSERQKVGPFLDGDEPVYADLIVGAWLAMMSEGMKLEDWQRVRTFQDGFWGRLHDALAPLRTIK